MSIPPLENFMLSKYRRNSKGLNVGLDVFIEFNAPPNSSLALKRTLELAYGDYALTRIQLRKKVL